ncbi:MAG: ATP-binding protein, partial [Lachnospiraceae bacterium]|nr:ATP-binding protein [Lachnospiraceae bacterium]
MEMFFWIVECIASFVELYMCGIFCGSFLLKEELGDRKYVLTLGSGIGALLVFLLNKIAIFSYVNSVLVIIIAFLLQLLVYKTKAGLSLLLTLVYTVILAMIDFLTAYLAAFAIGTDVSYLFNIQSISRVVCILLSKSLVVLIVVTLNNHLSKSLVLRKRYTVIMGAYSIFLLLSVFVMVELNMKEADPRTELFLTLFFIISIIIELLMFYFVIKTGESYEQRQRAELIEMKNANLMKSLDETQKAFNLWRRSVHDYKNNIIALRQLAEDGKHDEIREYLNQESKLMDKKMFYISTGSSVVDAIVNTKQNFAEEKGITFMVNATIPKKCEIS